MMPVTKRTCARVGLWLGYLMGVILPLLTLMLGQPHYGPTERGNQTKANSNCRQILSTLKFYAEDHEDKYPDAAVPNASSSNEVFRQLIVSGEADNENIFACPSSRVGAPDGNIGNAPDYKEAVRGTENHWAMTKGLNAKSDGSIPLVFENPAEATWPPKWDPSLVNTGLPGRTWEKGKVIIGHNDGTVTVETLESMKGTRAGLKPGSDGKPVFAPMPFPVSILNIETRRGD